jgi:uncharacterized RDD family membrane protein YckC
MTTTPPPPPGEGQPGEGQPTEPGSAPPPPPPPPPPSAAPPPQTAYGAPAYGAAPPPATGATPTGTAPGGLLDRFLARLIDGILLAIVNGVLVGAIVIGAIMGESGNFFIATGTDYAVSAVSAILSTAIYLGYFVYMESSRGQTVGKMILKLRTTGPDGGNPTLEQAVRRNIWVGLGILGIVPILGLLGGIAQLVAVIMIAVGINKDAVNRQGWHDHFAGETRVLKIG